MSDKKDEEKDFEKDSIVANRYKIVRKIGSGSFAKVYLVIDLNDKNEYAAKILLKNKQSTVEFNSYLNEINVLKKLTEAQKDKKYVVEYHDSGVGDVEKSQNPNSKNRQYLITSYQSKGNLYVYLSKTQIGFKEKHAKIIFSKILEDIQFMHNLGICHLDIKPDNILLDSDFNPIITDFGLSCIMSKKSDDEYEDIKDNIKRGSHPFICPEMNYYLDYNGIQADIFSLGVVLLYLITNESGFLIAQRIDPQYKLIAYNNEKAFKEFWKNFANGKPHLLNISQACKDLLFKLLAYKQNNRMKNIKEIFNDPWMKDMENYKEEDYKEYEEVMKALEIEVSQDNETLENNPEKDNMAEEGGHITKSSLDDNKTIYFDKNTKKNYLYKTGLNAMNYIKIKGKLNQEDFMNNLADKLIRIYQCKIIPHPEKLKFEVIFKNEKNEEIMEYRKEEGEEEEEEENIEQFKYEDCGIKIKLFELIDGGYEIHFNRSQGSFMDYYKNFQNIKIIIKKILT